MKKEENDDELNSLLVQPKNESRDGYKCSSSSSGSELFTPEVEIKKPVRSPSSNGVEKSADSMNGVIELDESSSDSDEDRASKTEGDDNRIQEDSKAGLKKEETHEEKFIADMIMDDKDEMNPFPSDATNEFNFNFNVEDDLPADFLVDDENPLAGCEGDTIDDNEENEQENAESIDNDNENSNSNEDQSTVENDTTGDTDENEVNENENADNETSDIQADTGRENDLPFDESVPTEADDTAADDAATDDAVADDTAADDQGAENLPITTDHDDENEPSDTLETKTTEEADKEADSEMPENKRPLSRESTASNASSSSERTLTVRSASELNKLVSGSSVVVKTEKESATSSEKVEKPGLLSVLNPSQLGATDNAGGENLLQSNNFVQSGDTMMGFMSSNLQNGVVPLQCDVCDLQFADNLLLEDHRAVLGHYKCHYSPECANFVFQSIAEFSNHQQTIHGVLGQSPVQQLAHQVQTLPIRYQMDQPGANNYQKMPSYQQGSPQVHSVSPMTYPPSQNNVQIRQYNVPGSPRLQIGAVRSVLPNPLKRGIPNQPSPPRLTPPKRRCVDTFPTRNGDADCKVVSVQKPDNTDDVVAQLSKSITITARQETQKKSDTAAVANMLANRGITVSSVPNKPNRNSNPVTMLNLNSAVSLIPTNANNRQNSGFAVPQGRLSGVRQPVPGRMQTVDLTGPDPPRNKLQQQVNRTNRFLCQICDRSFFNQDQLNQHMMSHRSGGLRKPQLPYKCNTCTAQYPTQQGLIQHKQTCRRDAMAGTNEMVIPIVDLKQTGTLQRLQAIGINHMIPLSALGAQASNGTFGIPILPFSSDRNAISNLTNCGISNILPVGPLKTLGR